MCFERYIDNVNIFIADVNWRKGTRRGTYVTPTQPTNTATSNMSIQYQGTVCNLPEQHRILKSYFGALY